MFNIFGFSRYNSSYTIKLQYLLLVCVPNWIIFWWCGFVKFDSWRNGRAPFTYNTAFCVHVPVPLHASSTTDLIISEKLALICWLPQQHNATPTHTHAGCWRMPCLPLPHLAEEFTRFLINRIVGDLSGALEKCAFRCYLDGGIPSGDLWVGWLAWNLFRIFFLRRLGSVN